MTTSQTAATPTSGDCSPIETSRVAHWLAILFVLLVPTATTYVYFIVLSGQKSMSVVYGATKVVQFAFPLVWVLAIQRQRLSWQRPQARPVLWGVAFGVFVVLTALAVYFGYFKNSPFLAKAPQLITAKVLDMGLSTPGLYLAFAVFLSVPHSLLEEYYWRWFAFGQLRRVTPVAAAIAISSVGFMAHHVIVIHQFLQGPGAITLFFSLCVAVGGAVWAWLYHRYRSLYAAWVSHFLVDCVLMYIGYDLVQWAG